MIEIVTIIAVGIAFIAVIVAIYAACISRKTMEYQALLEVQKDYRSVEMLSALGELWKFYRKCNDKKNDVKYLKEKYREQLLDEDAKILNDEMEIENSLNYKRRLITHFYIHLAHIHVNEVLPPKMIFDWWVPSDLKIFDKFIIPLQEETAEIREVPEKETKFIIRHLKKLKVDCESYFDKESKKLENDC